MLTVARIAFGAFFLGSAALKVAATDTLVGMMREVGFSGPEPLVYLAAAAQAIGGAALIANVAVREAALGLIAYVAIINLFMHAFWLLDGEAASLQFQLFSKNVGIMAGLLAVAGAAGNWAFARGTRHA